MRQVVSTLSTAESSTGSDDTPRTLSPPLRRVVAWLYVIGGAVGLVASSGLMVEKVATLTNPRHVPSCSLNPVLSCGSVMDSPQSSLFGFPNPLFGVAAFPVVITAGGVLLAGFHAPRWFWFGMQLASTLAIVFVHWLIYESLYTIGALCAYCMVVWVVTIPIFWYSTLQTGQRLQLPRAGGSVIAGLVRFHTLLLTLWYLAIVVLILQAFWRYWSTLV